MHIANADGNRVAKCDTDFYCDAYSYTYSTGYGYTYRAGYSYTHRIAKLHTELRIHIGNRNDRAGSHRHRKPLR